MGMGEMLVFCCALAAEPGLPATESKPANAETISGEQLDLARRVLTGFRESRGRLRRGVFRVSGARNTKNPRRQIDHAGEIGGFVAVDFEENAVRFERREPSYKGHPVGGRYIKKEEMVVSRRLGAGDTSILRSTAKPDISLMMFDIRTAGLANDAEFEMNVGLDRLLDELLPESNLLEARKEKQLYRLSWKTGRDALKRSVWFDENSGFSPVRLETRYRAAADLPPMTTCDVTWIERDAVWVPETLTVTHRPRPDEERDVTYAFEWISVNQTLDDQLFAVAALQEPGERPRVVDYRLDKPIVVFEPASPTVEVQSGSTTGRVLLVALATLCVLCGLMLVRFFIKRRMPPSAP